MEIVTEYYEANEHAYVEVDGKEYRLWITDAVVISSDSCSNCGYVPKEDEFNHACSIMTVLDVYECADEPYVLRKIRSSFGHRLLEALIEVAGKTLCLECGTERYE